MIHYLFDPSGTLADLGCYWLFGEARFGGNGVSWMPPELVVGTGPDDMSGGRITWDEDLSDGLNSGQVAIEFDVDLTSGDATLEASNGGSSSPASFSGSSGGVAIGSIVIRAGTQVHAEVSWSNLTITCWNGDVASESVSISAGAQVDTTNSTTGVGEQMLVVEPKENYFDRVTVSGTLSFQASSAVCPSWTDLFGQIYIMPMT